MEKEVGAREWEKKRKGVAYLVFDDSLSVGWTEVSLCGFNSHVTNELLVMLSNFHGIMNHSCIFFRKYLFNIYLNSAHLNIGLHFLLS